MTILELSAFIWLGSFVGGLLGAMTGLGGGVVIVPLLSVGLGVDIRYAIGASLISVIATSSGAAAAFLKEGYTNLRIGMFLEIATTSGALFGATLAGYLPTATIAVIFGIVLAVSALTSGEPPPPRADGSPPDRLASRLKLHGSYPTPGGPVDYQVHHVLAGFGLMTVAGAMSGLLGIGSGALKVLAMDRAMRIPFKVSATTSNFMIGVTAAASAGVYLSRGYVDPGVAMAVMLGILPGAFVGSRLLTRLHTRVLRWIFRGVLVLLALQMISNGLTGRL